MWKLLTGGALAAGLLLPAAPALAYGNGPWCVKASVGQGVVTEICHFRSFEACRDERGSWGNAAFCVQNPRFLPYWQGGIEQQPRRARLKKHRHR